MNSEAKVMPSRFKSRFFPNVGRATFRIAGKIKLTEGSTFDGNGIDGEAVHTNNEDSRLIIV